jgi:hypothetical protein
LDCIQIGNGYIAAMTQTGIMYAAGVFNAKGEGVNAEGAEPVRAYVHFGLHCGHLHVRSALNFATHMLGGAPSLNIAFVLC